MVAEGALEVSEDKGKSKVAPMFTAMVELKPAKEVPILLCFSMTLQFSYFLLFPVPCLFIDIDFGTS